jgi:hypothetical protein
LLRHCAAAVTGLGNGIELDPVRGALTTETFNH